MQPDQCNHYLTGGRRMGRDRRVYSYAVCIPERRSGIERRGHEPERGNTESAGNRLEFRVSRGRLKNPPRQRNVVADHVCIAVASDLGQCQPDFQGAEPARVLHTVLVKILSLPAFTLVELLVTIAIIIALAAIAIPTVPETLIASE